MLVTRWLKYPYSSKYIWCATFCSGYWTSLPHDVNNVHAQRDSYRFWARSETHCQQRCENVYEWIFKLNLDLISTLDARGDYCLITDAKYYEPLISTHMHVISSRGYYHYSLLINCHYNWYFSQACIIIKIPVTFCNLCKTVLRPCFIHMRWCKCIIHFKSRLQSHRKSYLPKYLRYNICKIPFNSLI